MTLVIMHPDTTNIFPYAEVLLDPSFPPGRIMITTREDYDRMTDPPPAEFEEWLGPPYRGDE